MYLICAHPAPLECAAGSSVWMGHGLGEARQYTPPTLDGSTGRDVRQDGLGAGPSEVCVGWVSRPTCPVVRYETLGR